LPQPSQLVPIKPIPAKQPSASENLSSTYETNVPQALPQNNQRVAAAYLQTHELQDLVEKIAEIKSAAAGIELKFKVQIELGGES
jgi:hypothetical protein